MSESTRDRPRQVTVSAWLIMAGSVVIVLSVFVQVAGIHSLETRESVEKALDQPPWNGLGLGVDGVLGLVRILAMVAAGCATASAILGYQVLQRSRTARLVLTVLAVPIFVSGLVSGGFMSSIVAAAIVMLWFQPARDWFDGISRPAPEPRRAELETAQRPAPPQVSAATTPPPPPPPPAGPRPYAGFGAPSATGQPRPAYAAGPAKRPTSVVWACAITWATAGLTAVLMLLSAVLFALDPEPVLGQLRRDQPELLEAGLSREVLVASVVVVAGVGVLWCLAAAAVAWFAFRRASWAHVTLLCSAGAAGFASVAGTLLGSVVLLLPAVACFATIALLTQAPVRAWYADRSRHH